MSNLFIYLGRETGEQLGSSDREMMLSFDWNNLDPASTSASSIKIIK